MKERLSLGEGEGVGSIPSPPSGERARVRGRSRLSERAHGLLEHFVDGVLDVIATR